MRPGVAAVFCMPERGHLQRLLPLVASLATRGVTALVFTTSAFRASVERAGGRVAALFERYPLDAADAASRPVPCRYVTFAANYAAPLIEEMVRLSPSVIVYDTFAVIGWLLGRQLGIPYVNVCAGHNMSPANAVALIERDQRIAPSEACRRAVDALRDRWGIADASPLSYLTGLSPFLNVYCEPPAFLRPEERAAFQPIAFFGSISPPALAEPGPSPPGWLAGRQAEELRVYASFGSVVWRYYEDQALQALEALSGVLGACDRARGLISLGGHRLRPELRARLERPNVSVADYVDQWSVLRSASVCVTHQGLNSTHEAIYHRVPMIAYPFFGDQPQLAARCRELGVSVPLVEAVRGPVAERDVRAALSRVSDERTLMEASLSRARAWEVEVMEARGAVVQRILDLAEVQPRPRP